MKKMAREVLLETLKENGGSLPFNVVERKLWDHGLGFGVEPINVVHSAARDNLVDYDSKTRIVSQILNEFKIPRVFKILADVVLDGTTIMVRWPENKETSLYEKERYYVYKYDREQKGLGLAPIGGLALPSRFLPLGNIKEVSFIKQGEKVEIILSVTEVLEL